MRRAMGPSVFYSVLIVVAVAVAFREPDHPRPGLALAPRAAQGDAPGGQPEAAPPTPPAASEPPPIASSEAGRPPGRPANEPRKVRPVAESRPSPGGRRDDFAVVRDGESLADVVERIYGPGGSTAELWRANRDQLASPDDPLHAGMLLRTP